MVDASVTIYFEEATLLVYNVKIIWLNLWDLWYARKFICLDFSIYKTQDIFESLVPISKEPPGILEFKLLPFINMKLNLKINWVNL